MNDRPQPVVRRASNPFATRFVRPGCIEYRFANSSVAFQDELTDELTNEQWDDQSRYDRLIDALLRHRCGAIIGPHGTGKTTLVHSLLPRLHRRFPHQTHLQLISASSQQPWAAWRHYREQTGQVLHHADQLPPDSLLIIDGAEQLTRWTLLRLKRMSNTGRFTLLITSHRPLMGIGVLHRTTVDRDIVCRLADELTRQSAPAVKQIVAEKLNRLRWGSLDNVRQLWFELYDEVHPHLAACETSASRTAVCRDDP